MDIETLTNHISNLGKENFKAACKIVLQDVFNLYAIDVDGKGDGGTDFISTDALGERTKVAYQITTQKTDIKNKAYKDAFKSVEKLGVKRFYFLASYNLSEIDARIIEDKISNDLNIQASCFSARNIAGFLINENLVSKFLIQTDFPDLRSYSQNSYDYKEMALHGYTLISEDANNLRGQIYDDSVLFVLSDYSGLAESELIKRVLDFLGLPEIKGDVIKRRIGALFGKTKLRKNADGLIELNDLSKDDIKARKIVYEKELLSLASAQIDLLRSDYNIDWTVEDSRKVSIWIANSFIVEQIANLKEIKASITSNPIFDVEKNGIAKLKDFLVCQKSTNKEIANEITQKLLDIASNHPLIVKITRASVYLALEGANPISSAKALGANRWSDFDILVEPTVAIPYLCSTLYIGNVNRYFNTSIKSIDRAKKLGAKLHIPYFYINECAGHLLRARRFDNIDLNENEMQFSSNAFVANYYALKSQGINMPSSFIDYLSSFSPAIKTERSTVKDWVRSIMTDLQSLLLKANIEFVEFPFYNAGDCAQFEKDYIFYLQENQLDKPPHLIQHDVYALHYTDNDIANNGKHWIIITYDNSLIQIARNGDYKGWICSPNKFLDVTEITRPLSEIQFVSLVHSVATYSEKTLAIGARIIDRIVQYASNEMQNWEFKQEIANFKQELIKSINYENNDYVAEIDIKTDAFLKQHGIPLNILDEDVDSL